MTLGVLLMNLTLFLAQAVTRSGRASTSTLNTLFRRLQLVSAAAYSLGHGANDAQKTMGVIAAIILVDRGLPVEAFEVSLPIVLAAHAAIALGTMAGGWRIVHTLGSKITKLQPVGGFSAETAAAATLFGTATLGIPVSTTHTITGAIIGVGTVNRFSAVRWGLTRRVLYAWVLTIPGSAIIAAVAYVVLSLSPVAEALIIAGLIAAASVVVLLRRRERAETTVFSPP
jgi:PiT family inorganic phosphate transporter